MKSIWLMIPPHHVNESPDFPDRDDDKFVYSHLLRCCEKYSEQLAAITIKEVNGSFVVTRGHTYLRIAKELGRDKVRAVLIGEGNDDFEVVKEHPELEVVPKEVLESESNIIGQEIWHVLFVEKDLDAQKADDFVQEFVSKVEMSLLEHNCESTQVTKANYFSEGPGFEFYFWTPSVNIPWANEYHRILNDLSTTYVRIVTYQGRLFGQ